MRTAAWWAAAVAVAVVWLAMVVLFGAAARAYGGTCGHVTGPFRQSHGQIRQATGALYVPLGVTVSGLERQDWASFTSSDHAEIGAAAAAWCANTVRLQVSQERWAKDGPAYRAALADEVTQAEGLGLAVVVNDNTQWDTVHAGMPTQATKTFWRDMAALYADDGLVIFDLFNEPRAGIGWHCWHDGGPACSSPGLVGMQPLARYVRGLAPNLMWIDGPGTQLDRVTRTTAGGNQPDTLAAVKRWPIFGARPMMYSIHHPTGPHTISNWRHQFGWLAEQRYAPVVDGEWTNFAATRAECWNDAPQKVPVFLNYLAGLRAGMTVWKIGAWDKHGTQAGVLTTTDPTQPTGFGPWDTWRCRDGYHHSAGKQIQAWYAKLNT